MAALDSRRLLYTTILGQTRVEITMEAKMDKYSKLLTKTVKSIAYTFKIRTAAGLKTGRDFTIPDWQAQANDNSDFDLVTWLVIKGS